MDAKDILGLPKSTHPASQEKNASQEKKSRPLKESQRKPDGISREVYALTGGVPPLMPAVEPLQLKKRPPTDEKITWQWLPFTSSTRKDNLQLYHWVIVVNGIPPTGDYSFAKYNKVQLSLIVLGKSVDVVKYTDEEYEKHLTDDMWTKEETDQLFELCQQFDLRFIVIADRFSSSCTVEELKERYYKVSRSILIARAAAFPGNISEHPIVKEPYKFTQERDRKRALSMVLSQTKHQERKDYEVLAEAKRIAESHMAARNAKESELLVTFTMDSERAIVFGETLSPPSNSEFAPAMVAHSTSMAENASTLVSLRMLRVYLRTYALDQMIQAASSSAGLRTIKRVEQSLQELGVNLKPRVPTKAVCAQHLDLRKEILTLLNLQKQLQHKEAEGSSYRDGPYETPGTPKDRTFVPDSTSFGGDRVGKRDQKRKALGRAEAPSLPAQSKRPRKSRASDL
ncbi:SWR1-complex protein 4 isoform X2 [Pyrus x bretschneideri]|uniref:SWR1-complex protein 4 isoform X2 n=1 Tax=Pyrus x bretschneideri TaxID=225117 RepID=UPI00202F0977|nr:SWR1-complex protein 4 isoform X2 [Pyrus x bretschneideri]